MNSKSNTVWVNRKVYLLLSDRQKNHTILAFSFNTAFICGIKNCGKTSATSKISQNTAIIKWPNQWTCEQSKCMQFSQWCWWRFQLCGMLYCVDHSYQLSEKCSACKMWVTMYQSTQFNILGLNFWNKCRQPQAERCTETSVYDFITDKCKCILCMCCMYPSSLWTCVLTYLLLETRVHFTTVIFTPRWKCKVHAGICYQTLFLPHSLCYNSKNRLLNFTSFIPLCLSKWTNFFPPIRIWLRGRPAKQLHRAPTYKGH